MKRASRWAISRWRRSRRSTIRCATATTPTSCEPAACAGESLAVERAVLATGALLGLVDAEHRQLLAQRVAVEPEDLGGLELVATRVREHEVEQRPLDAGQHLVVEVVDRIAVDASEQPGELALDHLLEREVL